MFVPIRVDRPPYDDKRVRQALNYAIDKEALVNGFLNGLGAVPNGPMAPTVFGANTNLPPYRFDPDKAKRLLDEAGASGATFNFGIPIGRYLLDKEIGEAIAGYWTDVGLKVNAEATAWSAFVTEFNKMENSRWNGYLVGWGITTGEPEQQMREHYHSKSLNRTGWRNAEADRLIEEGAETFDEEKAKAAYMKAQAIVWDEAPWVFLYLQPDLNAISKRLQGFEARPDEWLILTGASLT
jgi:ABC-type transport system substrate-binding protein